MTLDSLAQWMGYSVDPLAAAALGAAVHLDYSLLVPT